MKFHCLKAHTLLLTSTTGDLSISGGFITANIDGANPQFTLTCISTGGPATIVSWTRDSTTVTEGNETVLLNPTTAEYLHTLKVTGDIKGRYTCTVANDKPSNASANMECEVARNLAEIFSISVFFLRSWPAKHYSCGKICHLS